MLSLHGIDVHGFPNLFVVGPAHGANLISNVPHNLVEAGETIARIIDHAVATGADEVEVTLDAETAWVERLEVGQRRFGGNPDCTPGYYNNEGHDAGRRGLLNSVGFPEGPVAYFRYIDEWRSSGDFAGLEFR
jgi:cyclohexanone monooxygenase